MANEDYDEYDSADAVNTIIPGSELVPEITPGGSGILSNYMFWVGVLPACPTEHIDVGGINFPKLNEKLVPMPGQPGKYRRVPAIGAIVSINRRKLEAIRKGLRLKVVRFLDETQSERESKEAENRETAGGTMLNMGDLAQRPRRGYVFNIPDPSTIEEARKSRSFREYIPGSSDEPAARYMFAVLCEDQSNPQRGEFYPGSIEDTGLEWPESLE